MKLVVVAKRLYQSRDQFCHFKNGHIKLSSVNRIVKNFITVETCKTIYRVANHKLEKVIERIVMMRSGTVFLAEKDSRKSFVISV